MNPPRASLVALLLAQAQVVFNQTAVMFLLLVLVRFPGVVPGGPFFSFRIWLTILTLPSAMMILFFPLAGWIIDRFSRSSVLNCGLLLQFGTMLAMIVALGLRSMAATIGCFAVLALQSAVFAVAKRAILRDLVGPAQLSRAVGGMEMLSLGSMLAGTMVGAHRFDHWTELFLQTPEAAANLGHWIGGFAWESAESAALWLAAFSLIGWATFQFVAKTPVLSAEPFHLGAIGRHGRLLRELWRERPLRRAAIGMMFSSAVAGYLGLLYIADGTLRHRGGLSAMSGAENGILLTGAGAVAGQFAAGIFSRRGVELGLVPIGGLLLALGAFALGTVGRPTTGFAGWLVLGGFGLGIILVPLQAFLQEAVDPQGRGRALAAVGLLETFAQIAGPAIFVLLVHAVIPADRTMPGAFYLLAAVTLLMVAYALWHLPHQTACTVMRLLGPVFYRVRALGAENIPAGGALLLCNHLSYVDTVVLQIASPRPIRFVILGGVTASPVVRFLLRAAGAIPVAPDKPLKGIRWAIEALQRGELVGIFPEGAISRTGQLMRLKRGFESMARHTGAPVIPAAIDGLWGSVFSFAGNKYLWKSPRLMPTPVCIVFGPPLAAAEASPDRVRKALLDAGERAFRERPALRRHLAREAVRALAKRPGRVAVIDRTAERRVVSAGLLLATAAALSRRIRATVPDARVGVVLPPGAGAHIANLAIACAGKTPVNMNFTAGRASLESSLRLGGVRTVITAEAMRAKVPQFPFPENTLDLKAEIAALGGRRAIIPWLLAAWVLPNQWMAGLLGLPKTGDDAEAALLFTSGSAGEPKGVLLTHRNVLANCAQISSLSILPATAVLVGCLPIFHSFGFTVTLWYPLLRGCGVVTIPSPLDTRRIVEAIAEERASVLIGAPTFVRPFLKKATREQLRSLDLVVTGAEKLPQDLFDHFLAQFGLEILEGYGLTEASPVTNINQPHPPEPTSLAPPQIGKVGGSVGRLLPGMTGRVVDPETERELALTDPGIVWLKGANIFPGYLDEPERTAAARRGEWFVTGDLGRFDEDGFLHIEGRLSRFSKIAGEMVPHGTIEERIVALFGWDQTEGPTAVVTAIPDATKGEAIVLLTRAEVSPEEVRSRLAAAGLPNLWIPRLVFRVDAIPVLGTGKTDLKACRALALAKAMGEK